MRLQCIVGPMGELVKGKGGTYYPPFPVLGLASAGDDTFLACGGGGSKASKEVPNLVQAYRYVESTGALSTIASLNTEKKVCSFLSYSEATGLWLASADAGCKALEFSAQTNVINELYEFVTELEGKTKLQNVARFSPTGTLIATGGTDGIVKLWSTAGGASSPSLVCGCQKGQEVLDLDFSPDGQTVVSCDRSGSCHLWKSMSGELQNTFKYDGPDGKPMNIRCVRFLSAGGIDPSLAVAANGGKGAFVALFDLHGTKLRAATCDSKPLTSMSVDVRCEYLGVVTVTGRKQIYSLPSLRREKQITEAHDLPAPCSVFVCNSTMVSGSGDRCFNLLTFRRRAHGGNGGFGCLGCVYWLTMFLMLMIAVALLVDIGIKGAAVQNGRGSDL